MKLLIEGIKYNEQTDHFDFDWKQDTPQDLIDLKLQKFNKYTSTKQGFDIYYAYKFNKDLNKDLKSNLRNSIKYVDVNKINKNDLDLFLSKSINSFNQIKPLSEFDLIVFPKSTSKILELIKLNMSAKAGSNTLISTDLFIKNSIENIKYNEDKLNKLAPEKREQILKLLNKVFSKEEYKLKSIPSQYRKFIDNFLGFNTKTERRIFNILNGGKVLIVDDILTEGTTFVNMAKLINSLGENQITGFILISNK
jgi:phosphoribosylpyrophosphate synthetase